ncbi:MAG TPA: hypothetical protein VK137_16210 [Planctomycetaceae bacterium]|nr:hypothetical protein [Planctomycetaceae bacterium]
MDADQFGKVTILFDAMSNIGGISAIQRQREVLHRRRPSPVLSRERCTQDRFEFQDFCEVVAQRFLASFEHHMAAAIGRQAMRFLRDDRATALAVINRTIVNHA